MMSDLDLLPKKEQPKKEVKEKTPSSNLYLTLAIFILILTGLIIVSLFIYKQARQTKTSGMATRIEKLDSQIAKINKLEGEEETLEEKAKTVQNQLSNIKRLLTAHTYWSFFLDELAGSTHKEVQYSTLSYNNKEGYFSVEGNTTSFTTLAYFITSLDINNKIENAELESAGLEQNEEGKNIVTFIVKFYPKIDAFQKETK